MEKGFYGNLYSKVEKAMYREPLIEDSIPRYISDRYVMEHKEEELKDIEAVTTFPLGNNNVTIIRQRSKELRGNSCYFRINEKGIGLDLFYIIYISIDRTINDCLFSYYLLYKDILDIIYKQVGQFPNIERARYFMTRGDKNGWELYISTFDIECIILAYTTLKSVDITSPTLHYDECVMNEEMKNACKFIKEYIDENIVNESASDLVTKLLDCNYLFSIMNNSEVMKDVKND